MELHWGQKYFELKRGKKLNLKQIKTSNLKSSFEPFSVLNLFISSNKIVLQFQIQFLFAIINFSVKNFVNKIYGPNLAP